MMTKIKQLFPKNVAAIIANEEKNDYLNADLQKNNETRFELFYSGGVIQEIDGTFYLITNYDEESDIRNQDTLYICLKFLNDETLHVLFDEKIHGYDNLFVYEHQKADRPPLQQLIFKNEQYFTGKITFGIGIDYEAEKDLYEVTNDCVNVLNRTQPLPWDEVKREGYDYLNVAFLTEEKKHKLEIDIELA